MSEFSFKKSDKPLVKVGFIGCGSHAARNVYTALQWAPVDLQAVCDLDLDKAKAFARQFGAHRAYAGAEEMLEKEDLDGVYIVTNYDQGKPRYPKLAMQCMEAGAHAWVEKPPAWSSDEVRQMMEVEKKTGKFTMVGLKKMFFPANVKAREISRYESFGGLSAIYCRYPEAIPEKRDADPTECPGLTGFLDHIYHPGAILQMMAGPVRTVFFRRNNAGGAFAHLTFDNGVTGCLHLTAGQPMPSPLERLELIGNGENVIVDNGVKLTYYRKGTRGPGTYGNIQNFIGPDETAPIYWEPEFSLGQLYNKNLFTLGYAQETAHFAECIQNGTTPEKAHLQDTLEIAKLFEAFRKEEGVEHGV